MGVVPDVIPVRCERSREWASLRLDGMLSFFESALLDRHLRRCADCRSFAAAVSAHTHLLRSAELEEPGRRLEFAGRRTSRRRSAVGAALVAVVAAAAAVFAVGPSGQPNGTPESARVNSPVFVVVPARPMPDSSVEVPRLTLQPASIADGPIRGAYFNLPSV
jgi:hypothetical protein